MKWFSPMRVRKIIVVSGAIALVSMIWACSGAYAGYVSPSGCSLWLKADSIMGASNGASVQLWQDSSGNGRDFVQYDNITNAPTYVASGVNGQPVLRFNGHTDGTGQGLYENGNWRPALSGMTIFAVTKMEAGGNDVQGYFGNGSNRVAFGAYAGTNSEYPASTFWAWTPNAYSTYGAANSLNTNWNIHAYALSSADEATWTWYENGTLSGAAALTSGDPLDYIADNRLWVGYSGAGNEVWKGDIAEIIVFDHVLSDTDRTVVTSYLADKYLVPEPTSVVLLATGICGLLAYAWRKRK